MDILSWPCIPAELILDQPLRPDHSWQVNGKMRGSVEVEVDIGQDGAVVAAQAIPAVAKQLDGKPVKKVIFVPGKILNLIVSKLAH